MVNVDLFSVTDNEVSFDYKEGITIKVGSCNGTISGNYVHDEISSNGYQRAGIYLDSRGYQFNIDITDNIVQGRFSGILLASEDPNQNGSVVLDEIDVYNNLVYNIADFCFGITDSQSSGKSGGHQKKNIRARNNTFLSAEGFPNILIKETPYHIENLTIENNILDSDPGGNRDDKRWILFDQSLVPWPGGHWPTAYVGSQADVSNNLYAYPVIEVPPTTNHFGSYPTPDDPEFKVPGTGDISLVDFSLDGTSPALGTATGASPSKGIFNPFLPTGVPTGTPRQGAFDLGAFEQ